MLSGSEFVLSFVVLKRLWMFLNKLEYLTYNSSEIIYFNLNTMFKTHLTWFILNINPSIRLAFDTANPFYLQLII